MELLTEHRPVNGPVVYGFLHLVNAPAGRAGALTAALTEYCRWHELLLGAVFTERVTPTVTALDDSGSSAAFTSLIDVLALPDTYGVVLPAASHLGPKAIAAEREEAQSESGRGPPAAGPRHPPVPPGRPRPPRPPAAPPAARSQDTPRPGRGDMRLTMPDPTQQYFTAKPESVGQARDFALTTRTPGGPRPAPGYRLCVSELASNAVVHGSAPGHGFLVKLEADDDFVRLESTRQPQPPPRSPASFRHRPVGPGPADRRGVLRRVGLEDRLPFGKVVWSHFKARETPR